VVALNPCPCGFFGDAKRNCTCTPTQIQRYESKLSGPLQDRIDMHLEVPALKYREMSVTRAGEPSARIKERVERARAFQANRFANRRDFRSNGRMKPRDLKIFCRPDEAAGKLLEGAVERLGLSARSYHKILKIARTIADLEQEENIKTPHVAEAIQYRRLDRRK